jgi:PAS domain S-box-containing protein
MTGAVFNITERKKAEEVLRETTSYLENLFNYANAPIIVWNPEFKITKFNPAFERFTGYSANEVVGQKLNVLFPEASRDTSLNNIENTLKGERWETVEIPILCKNGEIRLALWNSANVYAQDNKTLIVTIAQGVDITDRKKAEDALQQLNKALESTVQELSRSSQEIEDFAHLIAHNLKAPLRAIGTLADWIARDCSDKFNQEGKERIKLLKGRVTRMGELIDSVLRYSEIRLFSNQTEKVNLNTLVTETIDQIAPPENIEITIENELPTLMCEKAHLTEVFQNLLSNAVKYMDKPQGRVRIECVEEDDFWKFSIADNGPGIKEQHFERIFKIFQTLLPCNEIGSAGIGLTVVKKIVELYGGKIWLESKVGEGSTFFFTLPKQEAVAARTKLYSNASS